MNNNTVTTSIETITPAMAAEYLSGNENNRNLRAGRVAVYAQAMADGDWRMTGEPICFNGSKLLNGQHRLSACIKANTPFTTVVVRGIAQEAMTYMDSGLMRTMGDHFKLQKQPQANALAALVRLVMSWENDALFDSHKQQATITRGSMEAWASGRDRELYESIHYSGRVSRVLGVSARPLAAVHFRLLDIARGEDDLAMANDFLDALATGAGMNATDPRLALRNYLTGPTGKRPANELVFVSIRAWNAFVLGEERLFIRPRRPGDRMLQMVRYSDRALIA